MSDILTESTKKQNKTGDINQYMREYRLKNLEKIREQERQNYHKNKYRPFFTPEEIETYGDNLKLAYKYKMSIQKTERLLLNLIKNRII
jgi:hypothetical protein